MSSRSSGYILNSCVGKGKEPYNCHSHCSSSSCNTRATCMIERMLILAALWCLVIQSITEGGDSPRLAASPYLNRSAPQAGSRAAVNPDRLRKTCMSAMLRGCTITPAAAASVCVSRFGACRQWSKSPLHDPLHGGALDHGCCILQPSHLSSGALMPGCVPLAPGNFCICPVYIPHCSLIAVTGGLKAGASNDQGSSSRAGCAVHNS